MAKQYVDCAGFGTEGPPCSDCPDDTRCRIIDASFERYRQRAGELYAALCHVMHGRAANPAEYARLIVTKHAPTTNQED
jgi:hypothetical protein